MGRTIFFFIKLAIFVGIAIWLVENPGLVTVNWLGWELRTNFGLFALLVVLAVFLTARGWRILDTMLSAPGSWFRSRADKRKHRGYRALTLGLAAVAAGDSEEARRQARRADQQLQDPELTRLLSAQAAALAGDHAAAARYFAALRENPETAFIGLSGLLRQAVSRGDDEHALELAEEAFKLRPDAAYVATTQVFLLARARRWVDAQRAVYEAVRAKVLAEDVALGHRSAILVERARDAIEHGDSAAALSHAGNAVDSAPEFVPALIEQVRAEMAAGKPKRATRLVEDNWARVAHPDLAEAFISLVPDETPHATYRRVTELARKAPDHVESKLMVAAAGLASEHYNEARLQLETLSESELSPRACRLWATLEEHDQGDVKATRIWLERAASMDRDPSWTCQTCGAISDRWSAICGNCDGFNTLSWSTPAHVTVMAQLPHDGSGQHGSDGPIIDMDGAPIDPESTERSAA
jgi:HemY protein